MSDTVASDFDSWRPLWIVVNAEDHAKKSLIGAAMFHGGGPTIMYYVAIFTSDVLAKQFIVEHGKETEWKAIPFVILQQLISFMEDIMLGKALIDVRYVAIDVGQNTGVFIRVEQFVKELYHQTNLFK